MRSILCILIWLSISCFSFTATEAYQSHHNGRGNITIKWDLINWTPDGYVAVVTINNYQKQRGIGQPGWRLSWTWPRREVIWSMIGSQTTEQGDCSHFKGSLPNSCQKRPTIVDSLPDTPYNQQIANCCKGGVLSSWSPRGDNSTAAFQISVGQSGTTIKTVKLPRNFTFKAPRSAYTCGPARIVKATRFITPDGRRVTRALETWKIACFYSGQRNSSN